MIHGRYSSRFRRDTAATQEQLDQLLQDPDLLDPKRPVAMLAVITHEHGLVPDDEVVRQFAINQIPWKVRESIGDENLELSGAQLEVARRALVASSAEVVERLGRTQIAANRQVQQGELIAGQLMPFFEDLGGHLRRLIDRYVPEEHRDDFLHGFRVATKTVLIRAASLGDKG